MFTRMYRFGASFGKDAKPLSQRHLSTTKAQAQKPILAIMEKTGAKKNIGLISLNCPNELNVLGNALMNAMLNAIEQFENDKDVATIVITGIGKAFAAGASIKEMQHMTLAQVLSVPGGYFAHWAKIAKCSKPLIAAVNGFALGGGCEVAMMCDIIYASDKARFGQPEVGLGVIPGAGGTQRLIREIGKSRAMEMCLSGDQISAQEALTLGLVSKVVPHDQLLPETFKLAEKIGTYSKLTVSLCKEAINKAYEMTLTEGLNFERRLFHTTFGLHDHKEGMAAFVEKRPPKFTDD